MTQPASAAPPAINSVKLVGQVKALREIGDRPDFFDQLKYAASVDATGKRVAEIQTDAADKAREAADTP